MADMQDDPASKRKLSTATTKQDFGRAERRRARNAMGGESARGPDTEQRCLLKGNAGWGPSLLTSVLSHQAVWGAVEMTHTRGGKY